MDKKTHVNALTIADQTVLPGERKLIQFPMPELYDCSPMMMPIHVIRGKEPGPVLLVTSAIHGDELNGVDIVRRLVKEKNLSKLKGTLIAIPIVNMYGFLYESRYLMDRRDLNRSFPGSLSGSIASRLAHMLLNKIAIHATHIIDLHTGSAGRSNFPQIRANLDNRVNAAFAHAFEAPIVLDLLEPMGSFRHAMQASNVPFLIYEAGEALRFDEFCIKTGVKGIMRAMRNLQMLPPLENPRTLETFVAYTSSWIRAEYGGTIVFEKELGEKISQGDVIARIANPLTGEEYPVLATKAGIIIGKSNLPLAHPGKGLVHIACHKKPKLDIERESHLEEILSMHDEPNA
jgi:predicted deacylase